MSETKAMEDVQSSEDTRQIPINKVGIKDIRHFFENDVRFLKQFESAI